MKKNTLLRIVDSSTNKNPCFIGCTRNWCRIGKRGRAKVVGIHNYSIMDNKEVAATTSAAPASVEAVPENTEATQPATTNTPVVEEKKEDASVTNDSNTPKSETVEDLPYMSTQLEGASLGSSIINMMNTIVGAGVLSIPSTVKNAGIIGSFVLLAISLYLSIEGAKMLSASAVYTKEESYGLIGQKLTGKGVGLVGDIAMIVFDFGVSIAYFIILFAQVMDLLEAWCGIARETLKNNEMWITFLIMLFLGFPLLSVKTLDGLRFASAASVVCICLFVIISIYKGVGQLIRGGLHYEMFPQNVGGFSNAISVFFTSLCCHVNIPKMTSELKLPKTTKFTSKVSKMNRIIYVAFISCGAIYFLVGACGYFAYGNGIGANLLDNFAQDKEGFLNIVKLAYGFVVLFSYPVLSYAALVTFDKMIAKQPRPSWRRYLEAFIWSILSWFVAEKFPVLDKVFGITGSMCGILLCFAIPAIYFVGLYKRERAKEMAAKIPLFKYSHGRYIFAWVIFYIGIVAAVVFTVIQVKDLITGSADTTTAPTVLPTILPTLIPSVAPTVAA